MTRSIVSTTLALVLAGGLLAANADARPQRAYQTDKQFGLGVMLGAPSGLSGKYFLGESSAALAFGVGTYHEFLYDDAMEIHVDVLWHPAVLATTRAFTLPLYVGVGGRVIDHDDYWYGDRWNEGHSHTGLRIPIGIAFDFNRAPLDVFAELVPVWDFGDRDQFDHHDHRDLTGAVGLRYYF